MFMGTMWFDGCGKYTCLLRTTATLKSHGQHRWVLVKLLQILLYFWIRIHFLIVMCHRCQTFHDPTWVLDPEFKKLGSNLAWEPGCSFRILDYSYDIFFWVELWFSKVLKKRQDEYESKAEYWILKEQAPLKVAFYGKCGKCLFRDFRISCSLERLFLVLN